MDPHIKSYVSISDSSRNWARIIDGIDSKSEISFVARCSINEIAKSGDILNMEVVIDNGHDINLPDELGKYPIHEAAFYGQIEMVKFLLENGADIDAVIQPFNHTALHIAVKRGYHELAQFLIKKGARVDITDRLSGRNLLHIVAQKNDIKMAGILIAAGINTLLEDKNCMTARDIASKNNYLELEYVLLKVMQHHAFLLES